jgi:hypothetical protein
MSSNNKQTTNPQLRTTLSLNVKRKWPKSRSFFILVVSYLLLWFCNRTYQFKVILDPQAAVGNNMDRHHEHFLSSFHQSQYFIKL